MIRNHLSPKTLLSLTSSSPSSSPFPYSVLISYFSTSSPTQHSHSYSYSHSPSHSSESRNVRVSVWWDFENCNVPSGVNVFKVAYIITAAVRGSGIKGPVQITAFGDMMQLSRANQEALSSTGINLTHIPQGGKNSADRSLLVDLMYWVSQNPPPAHLFLISGDRDFASILHRLRMNNYNILLASKDTAPNVLCSAASIMWNWNALVREETLTGRYFNQPPDGPYGSWYGHYKVPLEDPFSIVERPTCSQSEELSEASPEPAVRPIPKAVVKQICHILSSYPNGVSITELRSELTKGNVGIDKDLYGYKKFSRFLLAMPNILKLKFTGDGQFIVRSIVAKPPEPFEPKTCMSTVPLINNGNQHLAKLSKSNGEDISISRSMDGKSSLSSPELNVEKPPRKVQQPPSSAEKAVRVHVEHPSNEMEQPSPIKMEQPPPAEKAVKVDIEQPPKKMEHPPPIGEKVVEVVNAQVTDGHLPPVREQDSVSEVGLFKKIWRILYGSNDDYSEVTSDVIPKKSYTSGDSYGKKSENTLNESSTSGDGPQKNEVAIKCVKLPSQDDGPVHPASCSTSIIRSNLEEKTAVTSEPSGEKSGKSPGLFSRIMNWCKFWADGPNSNTSDDQPSEVFGKIKSHSGKHEILSEDSFWKDMESFIDTKSASLIISQARTREQMAQNLQKEGPLALKSLNESDILQLVDMLVSEKKWVEEYPSEASPFKLTRSVGNNTFSSDSHSSNGLRSIFLSTPSQSDLQRPPKHDGDKRIQNISHDGVSTPVFNRKPSERSRSEILVDCQNLVTEILKEFPEGYNMGSFRKLFLERYGYHLDVKKLGYQKLASLLRIMPGVLIESHIIFPSIKTSKSSNQDAAVPNILESNVSHTTANSDSELSDASKKDDESDSPWEELGPVDKTGSSRKEAASRRKAIEETKRHAHPDYESALSDDELSDSEGESLSVTRQKEQVKPRIDDEDSSLLQILDSWYSSKEGENTKDKAANVEDTVDCSTNGFQPSDSSVRGTKIETSLGNYGRKQGPQKSYSFVADHVGNNQDKLIEGILGSLKKSGESRMQG